ncbi:MAG: hypothetical protein ACP5RK_03185 [Candidatus Micrarchaeia archaeon]
MDGEFIKMYIYDIPERASYEIKDLFKNSEDFSKYEYNTPTPEELPTFTLPQVYNLKGGEFAIEDKPMKYKVQVALYTVGGAYSIRIRVPIENIDFQFLARFSFDKNVVKEVDQAAEKIKKKVDAELEKQFSLSTSKMSEVYEFYFINSTKGEALKAGKNVIPGLLIDEPNPQALDPSYIEYVLSKSISYNTDDIFYVGWEGAVLIDRLKNFDYELLVAEIANIQLLKLRVYKAKTSEILKKTSNAVAELDSMGFAGRLFSNKAERLNSELGRFEDDLREMLNRIENTVFSMGEWYLSRLYNLFASAFRLNELKESLIMDSETIEKRKSFVEEIISAKRNDILELVIIFLIIAEIIIEALYLYAK